jgi:hypothetical protein
MQLVRLGLVGKDVEAIVDKAYWIGRLKNTGFTPEEAHSALEAIQSKFKIALTPIEKAGIELARQTITTQILKHKETVKGVVSDIVLSGNYNYRNVAGVFESTLEENLFKREGVAKIAQQLREKTGDMHRDWKRVATTELTNAMNAGALDEIKRDNPDKKVDETYVYKAIVIDLNTCKYCKKFYLEADGQTPKIYTLAELQANGTNIGKKQAEWLPTIGATHPNCRGLLLSLPDGWGFEPGTQNLKYYNKNF